jgi:glycerol-3-phosphate O-acyltransferase
MAARLNYNVTSSFAALCRVLWTHLYAGVDMRDEDLERMRQASRDGVSVLTPCHRSHMDYLLLSSLMYDNDIIVPYIVAGDNLAFFPLGWYFRRSGAFFIKRSFKGERLFPVLFQTYMTHLMREGYTLEFFIEGGRSRTGKLLPPKLGVLSNTVQAGIEARLGRTLGEVSYLPIAVSYEQVVEERPYARELGGEPKKKESLVGVVKASGVIFKRYGRVYVRVGEPILLSEFVKNLPAPWEELDREHRREALQSLGERILHRIDRLAVVLPTGLVALALLCRAAPAHPAKVLQERIAWIDAFLQREGAEFSTSLNDPEPAIREALARFLSEGLVERIEAAEDAVFRVVGSRRITLEYYKNQLLHFFVPASLLAAVIRSRGSDRVSPGELRADFQLQLFLFRYEFVFDSEVDDEGLEQRALKQLEAAGALTALADGGWLLLNPERLDEVAGLTDTFREGYCAVLATLPGLRNQDFDKDDLARAVQKAGQRLLDAQEILRPEALSLANLRNALRAFQEDGLYRLRAGSGGLELDGRIQSELVDRLRPLGRYRP